MELNVILASSLFSSFSLNIHSFMFSFNLLLFLVFLQTKNSLVITTTELVTSLAHEFNNMISFTPILLNLIVEEYIK